MRKIAIILFLIVGLVSIDMLSKNWITNITTGNYVPLIGEYLGLQLSYNPGIAFSLPITGLPLQVLTIFILLALVYYYIRYEYRINSRILDVGYVFVFAGAISHAYERIMVGYVIDFISVKYFAILNFADIFISIGACLILLNYYVKQR